MDKRFKYTILQTARTLDGHPPKRPTFQTRWMVTTRARYRSLANRVPKELRTKRHIALADFSCQDFRQWLIDQLGGMQGSCPCEYCGARLTIETLQIDHKRSVAKGGTPDLDNLAIACKACNLRKGALDFVDYQNLLDYLTLHLDPIDKQDILHRLETAVPLAISRQRAMVRKYARVRYLPHMENRTP